MSKNRAERVVLYGKLVRLAGDRSAAPNERVQAKRRIDKLDREDPGIRLEWARQEAAERAGAGGGGTSSGAAGAGGQRSAGPNNPGRPPPSNNPSPNTTNNPNTAPRPLWDQLYALFGSRVERLVQASAEELIGATVLAVDQALNEVEDIVKNGFQNEDDEDGSLDSSDDDSSDEDLTLDAGTIDWDRKVRKPEHVGRSIANGDLTVEVSLLDEDELDDVEGLEVYPHEEAGTYVEVTLVLPFDLLARLSTSAPLSMELLARIVDAIDGDEDDED